MAGHKSFTAERFNNTPALFIKVDFAVKNRRRSPEHGTIDICLAENRSSLNRYVAPAIRIPIKYESLSKYRTQLPNIYISPLLTVLPYILNHISPASPPKTFRDGGTTS